MSSGLRAALAANAGDLTIDQKMQRAQFYTGTDRPFGDALANGGRNSMIGKALAVNSVMFGGSGTTAQARKKRLALAGKNGR